MAIHAHSTTAPAVQAGLLPRRDARGRFVKLAAELPPGPLLLIEPDTLDAIRVDLDALVAKCGHMSTDPVPAKDTPLTPHGGAPVRPAVGQTLAELIAPEDRVASVARTLHLRRQLAQAAEHGAALLDALDLSPLALDVVDDAIRVLDALDGDADDEPTLGAPERSPYAPPMGASFYKPANGRRLQRCFDTRAWNQAAWAAGSRLDGEGEPEAGYDLPEGDDELCGSEHDGCEPEDHEGELGSPIGDGDQEHWAQGYDSETVNEDGDGETGPDANAPHPYSRPISPRRPDTMGHQMRDDTRAIARRARDVRARLQPAEERDPDTVTIIRAGVAVWSGPYVTRDGIPVVGCAT